MTKKCKNPVLFFSMQLDSPGGVAVPGMNKGRLALFDMGDSDDPTEVCDVGGYIGHWVCYSSFDGRQKVKDWNVTGGVVPPNYAMPGVGWFWWSTKLIIQPGQPVPRGFIIYYNQNGKLTNNWTTKEGVDRSQIMAHPDSNVETSPGSYGCYVMHPKEWENFERVFLDACGHLAYVRCGNMYTYQ